MTALRDIEDGWFVPTEEEGLMTGRFYVYHRRGNCIHGYSKAEESFERLSSTCISWAMRDFERVLRVTQWTFAYTKDGSGPDVAFFDGQEEASRNRAKLLKEGFAVSRPRMFIAFCPTVEGKEESSI